MSFYISILILNVIGLQSAWASTNVAGIPCGKQFDRVPKIIGGIPSFQDEFPWIISLKRNGKHYCSGALVHSRYVLTAASCLNFAKNVSLDSISVTTGEYFLNKPESPVDSIDYSIDELITHPDYHEKTHENDIAILRLSKNVFVRPPTWPACLADYGNRYEGIQATVAGWGVIYDRNASVPNSGKLSGVLRKVSIPVWRNSECQQSIWENGFNFTLKYNHMCAGLPQGGKDTCSGDSGAPLLTKSDDGLALDIIGVTIGGRGCGRFGLPGIYTRVSDYLSWIQAVVVE